MDIIRISETSVCIRCRTFSDSDLKLIISELFGDAECKVTTYSNGESFLIFAEKRLRRAYFLQ